MSARSPALVMAAALTLAPCAFATPTLTIREPGRDWRPGDKVTATLTGVGTYTVESDLRQQSWDVTASGATAVDVGTIPGPGVFCIRARGKDGGAAAVVFTAARAGGRLAVAAAAGSVATPVAGDAGLGKKLARAVTPERVRAAAERAAKKWPAENLAALGATATTCTLCVVPGGQFACSACASTGAKNAADFAVEVGDQLVALLRERGDLTKPEADRLQDVLKAAKGLITLTGATGAAELGLAGLKSAAELTLDAGPLKLVVTNAIDQADKAVLLIKITKGK